MFTAIYVMSPFSFNEPGDPLTTLGKKPAISALVYGCAHWGDTHQATWLQALGNHIIETRVQLEFTACWAGPGLFVPLSDGGVGVGDVEV